MPSAEDTIRDYLSSLSAKPAARKPVVDREAVKALTAQIKAEPDPINRLRLYAAREEARKGSVPEAVDDSALEAAFVETAKAWADAEGISVDAFLAQNVPGDVLRRAGFTISATSGASSGGGGARRRAAAIPIHEVDRAIDSLGSGWRLTELAAKLDREPATVRNYVKKLVDDGALKVVGEDASGQGRPAKLYARA